MNRLKKNEQYLLLKNDLTKVKLNILLSHKVWHLNDENPT